MVAGTAFFHARTLSRVGGDGQQEFPRDTKIVVQAREAPVTTGWQQPWTTILCDGATCREPRCGVVTVIAKPPSHPGPIRGHPGWFLAAFLVAFVATGLGVSLRTAPLGDQGVEADFFAELAPAAQHLVAGDFTVRDFPFKGPVYAILLAAMHTLGAPWDVGWYRAGVALSLLASALTLLLLYRLIRRLAGLRAALVVVVLTAVIRVFFEHAGKASSDQVFTLWVVATAHQLLTRPAGAANWVSTGVLAGLAVLTRYIGAVVPLWCLVTVFLLDPDRLAPRQRWYGAACLAAGCSLVLLPWMFLSLRETGTIFATKNLQNVVMEFYGGAKAQDIPATGFASLGDLIGHDPVYFVRHYAGNLLQHLRQDFQQITGTVGGTLAGLGLAATIWRRPDRRQVAWFSLGVLYFLALCTVFYLPRFSLALTPFYAHFIAAGCDRLPRYRNQAAIAVVAVIAVAHVGHIQKAIAFNRAQQPLHLTGAIAYLSETTAGAQDRATVMARKAHVAHYAGMDFQPYPKRFSSAADLLQTAARRQVDYLVVGTIERQHLIVPTVLDHLDAYEGVTLVFADNATRVFHLQADAPTFGTRPDIAALQARWQGALAAANTGPIVRIGQELGRLLSEDGDFGAARIVMQAVFERAADERPPQVGLNLAWLCLQVGDTVAGLNALDETLAAEPTLRGTQTEARCRELQGRLLIQQKAYAAARERFVAARDLYRNLGLTREVTAVEQALRQLPPRQ